MIDDRSLAGSGIGCVGAHLLAAVLLECKPSAAACLNQLEGASSIMLSSIDELAA